MNEKVEAAISAAKDYPFVLLHINGADEAAHRKNRDEKNDFLHKVDADVVGSLLQSGHDVYVVSDHGTDPITGQHIGNRQPMFSNVSAKLIRKKYDKTQRYSHMTESERKESDTMRLNENILLTQFFFQAQRFRKTDFRGLEAIPNCGRFSKPN